MKSIVIREERPEDITVISEVTVAAFKELEMSDLNEHNIINGLREAGALSLSLVAEHEGCVVGHIAFSPVTVSDGTEGWYGLGPVSVVPKLQRRGITGRSFQAENQWRSRVLPCWPSGILHQIRLQQSFVSSTRGCFT